MVNVIDYVPGSTVLHRLNPVAKLALAAGIILATFLGDTFGLLVGLFVLTLVLGAYAGVLKNLCSLLKLLVPMAVLMVLLQTAFVRTGRPVALWVTSDGLATGAKACLRLLGVALPLILMLTVTKLTDMANACVEKLHVPYRYAFTFTTALRFVPVFGQEMNAIMEAQTARGVEYDTKNPLRKVQLMLPLARWARPTPRRSPPSSADSTCVTARAPTGATRTGRLTSWRSASPSHSSSWASFSSDAPPGACPSGTRWVSGWRMDAPA